MYSRCFGPIRSTAASNKSETLPSLWGLIEGRVTIRILPGDKVLPTDEALHQDAMLVAQAKSGDLSAFGTLVQGHQIRIARLAQRILSATHVVEDIEDITQEVFLRAYRNLPRFREQSSFGTWLTRICINYCIKQRNKRRRWRLHEPLSAAESLGLPEAQQPDRVLEEHEQGQQVRCAVEQLAEKYRLVVVLRYFEGYSCEEIAQLLDCSSNTVRTRLFRAHAQLNRKLQHCIQPLLLKGNETHEL